MGKKSVPVVSRSKKNEVKYNKQRIRTAANKTKAWRRHLLNHPKDEQNIKAISKARG